MQIFTGERLRYSLSDSLTECAFPSAEREKKYSSETVDTAL